MRLVLLLVLAAPACAFQVDGVRLGDDGGPDLTGGDGGPDLSPPDLSPPDLVLPPQALLALDATGGALFAAGQRPLADLATTAAHYFFDEPLGAGGLVDQSGHQANLDPVDKPFSGARGRFTHLPPDPRLQATGFRRVATEMTGGTGFVATARPALLDVAAQDFTVEAWLKLPVGFKAESASSCDPIVYKVSDTGYLLCALDGGRLRAQVLWSRNKSKLIDATVPLGDGAWHLVTAVYRPGQPNLSALYIDGAVASSPIADLSIPNGASLANTGVFTVGGAGGSLRFRGALAELAVHLGTARTLADHQASYTAFRLPLVRPAAGSPDVTYTRQGTLCTVVADEQSAEPRGDRVACYAGAPGLPAQVAFARAPAADGSANPGGLGLALAGPGENFATYSEQLETWYKTGTVTANAAISPRADLTADLLALPVATSVHNSTSHVAGAGPRTFSLWLRGKSDSDFVFLRIDDGLGAGGDHAHCLATLSTLWRRYSCTATFQKQPGLLYVGVDTIATGNEPKAQAVTVEAWGAQLERAAAATPYLPNDGQPELARTPVVLSVDNTGGRYLAAASGRVRVAWTAAATSGDGSVLFDGGPGGSGRVILRLVGGGLAGEVLDAAGAGAADSLMTIKPLDPALPHAASLAWSAASALVGGHTTLGLDQAGTAGRQAAFSAGAPARLYLGTDQGGTLAPAGVLHALSTWEAP